MSTYTYFKCDRCNKRVDGESAEVVDREAKTTFRRWFRRRPDTNHIVYELCNHCAESFDRWLTAAEASR